MKKIELAVLAASGLLMAANAAATTVRGHYKVARGSITIVGDKGPMTWSKGEKSWTARVDKPLTWFFPWGGTKY